MNPWYISFDVIDEDLWAFECITFRAFFCFCFYEKKYLHSSIYYTATCLLLSKYETHISRLIHTDHVTRETKAGQNTIINYVIYIVSGWKDFGVTKKHLLLVAKNRVSLISILKKIFGLETFYKFIKFFIISCFAFWSCFGMYDDITTTPIHSCFEKKS